MHGAGAVDSRTTDRTISSRRPNARFQVHEEVAQEFRGESPKTLGTKKTSSALKSTGHRLIYDEPATITQTEPLNTPPKATVASRESPTRASGRFQINSAVLAKEFSARVDNPTTPTKQLGTRLQTQDIESSMTKEELLSLSSRRSSRRASVIARLQLQKDNIPVSTQETPVVSPNKVRPPSPVQQFNDPVQVQNDTLLSVLGLPSVTNILQNNGAIPSKLEPLPKVIKPLPHTRQLSARLKVHDGALPTRKPVPAKESTPATEVKRILERQHDQGHQSQSNHETTSSEAPTSPTTDEDLQARFVPLHTQWTYGQNVFGRYKKTPYFYSGNIATYLGAGMFMVVFDDGTLDYRVRREDIMLREYPSSNQPQQRCHPHHHERGRRGSENNVAREILHFGNFEAVDIKALLTSSADTTERRGSQPKTTLGVRASDSNILDLAPELCLLPSHHVMVDFSVSPPRELVLNFDNSAGTYLTVCGRCCDLGDINQTWQNILEDEALTMKRLECGVGYEDDSTQVSDSDESSEEDMSMTPWQQMTQTFGMGKAARGGQRRRSSVSSVSQIDRLSMKQKKPSITTPKGLKQIISDYLLRGSKVQPSNSSEIALAEHIRRMDAKLSSIRSALCKSGGFGPLTSTSSTREVPTSIRVVYERAPNGVRAYGTVTECIEGGGYAAVTEDEHGISVQVISEDKVDFLPSARELEQQLKDLERSQRVLFAGQKVHVSLYPGSRFSGSGLITLERDPGSRFHVLLANRIRLVNVPVDKISPVREKKKAAVTITEDQFLVCSNKVKVYIGDQIYVKCATGDDLDGPTEEEKLGLLNGIYSNRTAAVDFADGSTGYEVPPHLIFKRKRLHVPVDQDVRSLKNAVLMQASAAANGGAGGNPLVLEEGYQVKADHPSKASVESCVVIKTHRSTACDLRFSDGTIAFEVFPSQMIIDSVGQQRMKPKNATMKERFKRAHPPPEYALSDYVLAWSSRFGRYCSAKIVAKTSQDLSATDLESLTSTGNLTSETILYTLVFDYGEKKVDVPPDKITCLDDTTALTHTQRLTNFSIDTMGFELSPVSFSMGEAVMARVHGSTRYFNGLVESVNEKERRCVVCFDSSERDTDVPFSAMFSVDSRSSFTARTTSTKQGSGNNSSSEATSRSRFLLRHRNTDETSASEVLTKQRQHSSSGSVRNILKLVVENFLRTSRLKPNPEPRRGSHMITEIGARRLRLPDQ